MPERLPSSQTTRRIRIDHPDDGGPNYDRTLWADTDRLDTGLYNIAVEITPPSGPFPPSSAGISLSPAEVSRLMASMASWLAEQAERR